MAGWILTAWTAAHLCDTKLRLLQRLPAQFCPAAQEANHSFLLISHLCACLYSKRRRVLGRPAEFICFSPIPRAAPWPCKERHTALSVVQTTSQGAPLPALRPPSSTACYSVASARWVYFDRMPSSNKYYIRLPYVSGTPPDTRLRLNCLLVRTHAAFIVCQSSAKIGMSRQGVCWLTARRGMGGQVALSLMPDAYFSSLLLCPFLSPVQQAVEASEDTGRRAEVGAPAPRGNTFLCHRVGHSEGWLQNKLPQTERRRSSCSCSGRRFAWDVSGWVEWQAGQGPDQEAWMTVTFSCPAQLCLRWLFGLLERWGSQVSGKAWRWRAVETKWRAPACKVWFRSSRIYQLWPEVYCLCLLRYLSLCTTLPRDPVLGWPVCHGPRLHGICLSSVLLMLWSHQELVCGRDVRVPVTLIISLCTQRSHFVVARNACDAEWALGCSRNAVPAQNKSCQSWAVLTTGLFSTGSETQNCQVVYTGRLCSAVPVVMARLFLNCWVTETALIWSWTLKIFHAGKFSLF